jgi:hypothetical protein
MKLPVRPHQLVLRIATGASILNSGLSKRDADEDTAMGLHQMAVGTYPFLDKLDPVTFTRLLSAGEITLGTALLLPLVPSKLAGAGLSAFAECCRRVMLGGDANVAALGALVEQAGSDLDLMVVETARLYLDQIEVLSARIATLEKVLKLEAARSESAVRLMTMPGIGPVTAMAIDAFAPTMSAFKRGRDFAAWLGLVPRQHSSGGKQVLGRTSKMGQRDIRRLLIIGAMTVIRWAGRKGVPDHSWLGRKLPRKPRMLVAIALANKMARSIWAMMTKNENYRTPVLAVG